MQLPPGLSRQDVVALERRHVWPPYTSSERHESSEPLVVVGAEGPWLFDADGRKIIDANSSWWTCTLGHGHPRLRAALAHQAEQLMHVAAGGITHAPVALLAKELCEVAPEGLDRVHFSDDGSTAVEVAVKAAFQYWQQNGRPKRTRFVTLSGAYHGDTLGAASLAALDEFHSVFHPILFDVIRPPRADEVGGWERVFDDVLRALRERPDEIAGVIVEPVLQGAAGMQMYDPALLRAVREATHAIDTFLIADEVFTGYGRTGAMWACELADVAPDLLCTAKGFTAGVLPMAATLATTRVYDGFRGGAERALMHGHTFCGNPLGAAIAREVLAIYREDDVLAGIPERAALIERAFSRMAELDGVARVRTLGTIGAVDLGDEGYRGARGWKAFDAALARGAFLRPLGDTVYIAPPLNLDLALLTRLLDIVHDSVRQALAED